MFNPVGVVMRIAIHLKRWIDLNAFGSAFVECAFSVNAINAHPMRIECASAC